MKKCFTIKQLKYTAVFILSFFILSTAPLLAQIDETGEENYENQALQVAEKITALLDSVVVDTQMLSKNNFSNIEAIKDTLKKFSASSTKKIWYNIGTDEYPIPQKKIIPIYKRIDFINKAGQEIIKYEDEQFSEDLKNISEPENTEYKSETYFEDTINLDVDTVFISKLASDYISTEKIFEKLTEDQLNNYDKVISRDTMKQGVFRFSTPVFDNVKLLGIIVLSLDYQIFNDLIKHSEPDNPYPVVSTHYSGNYILVYDIDGNTIAHPKPNNLRGYLSDGTLAGYNETDPKNEGSIFNLFAYDKSTTYREMADNTINKKLNYSSSATDISGRTKLSIAVPIKYDNPNTNYKDLGVFGGLMMSISVKHQEETREHILIKLKALEVAEQVSEYLQDNPKKTILSLQKDTDFNDIAIQKVGSTGYTGILDSNDGTFYLHPQSSLIGTRAIELKENFSDLWVIIKKIIGEECKVANGSYKWPEEDGAITEKYLYSSCIKSKTADNKSLFVVSTAYLDELDAKKYLDKYKVSENFTITKNSIKQKAISVAEQINEFIKANPRMSSIDLANNDNFSKLAVQTIGKTGYTYLLDKNTGLFQSHPNPKINNNSYDAFKETFPVIWEIINKIIASPSCEPSDGFYDWADITETIREKYTYHTCIETPTSDGVKFVIGASTYLDDYENDENIALQMPTKENNIDYQKIFTFIFLAIIVLILVLTILHKLKLIKIQGMILFILLVVAFILISILFIFSSLLNNKNLRHIIKENYIYHNYKIEDLETDFIKAEIKQLINELKYLTDSHVKHAYVSDNETLVESFKRTQGHVYAIYYIDKNSTIAAMHPVNNAVISTDISDQAHMIKVKNTLKPVVSDIFNAVEGFKAVTVHYPIIKDNAYNGSFAILLNIDSFLSNISMLNNIDIDIESFLLDSNLTIIKSSNSSYNTKNLKEIEKYRNNALYSKIAQTQTSNFFEFSYNEINQLSVFTPIVIEDNTWYLLTHSQEETIYKTTKNTINNTWFNTIITILSLAVLGFSTAYLLTKSLRKEIHKRTKDIEDKSEQIKEQLDREADINTINKDLIEEQKKSKHDLELKVDELKKFQKVTINRELKMIDLKKKIRELEDKKDQQ